jgi:hypothetical protein
MSSMTRQETRNFRMDPRMLWQIIEAQAGTPAKALLEAAMNAVDAGATQVEIAVDSGWIR